MRSLLKTRWGYIYHPFTFLKNLSFFKNYFFACECKYVQRPEGMIILSGTGVAEAVTAPCGCYEPTPVLLQEAYVLATMATSFQHHCFSSLIGLFCCCCCCCTFRAISCVFSWCLLLMNIKQIKIVLFYLLAAQLHTGKIYGNLNTNHSREQNFSKGNRRLHLAISVQNMLVIQLHWKHAGTRGHN